jgi:hypothetical protein
VVSSSSAPNERRPPAIRSNVTILQSVRSTIRHPRSSEVIRGLPERSRPSEVDSIRGQPEAIQRSIMGQSEGTLTVIIGTISWDNQSERI